MENKNVEEKNNNSNIEYCDCGPECDCGDDCHCDEGVCDCGDHDCDCDCGCEEDFVIKENNDKKGFSCCATSGCFLRKYFFGIIIFLLGVFYLGKNMGWWNFDLDWSLFWPIILIICGLFVITKSRK